MRTVSVWDPAHPERPTISPDHPTLSPDLAQRVAEYLRKGTIVLRTTSMVPDVLKPGSPPAVRRSTFTDGEWMWNEQATYYISTYNLSPGEEFVRYCETRDFSPRTPTPDEIAECRRLLGLG